MVFTKKRSVSRFGRKDGILYLFFENDSEVSDAKSYYEPKLPPLPEPRSSDSIVHEE